MIWCANDPKGVAGAGDFKAYLAAIEAAGFTKKPMSKKKTRGNHRREKKNTETKKKKRKKKREKKNVECVENAVVVRGRRWKCA